MADLENGLWAGAQQNAPAPSINFTWVTAMAKGKHGGFALKGGNAQEGTLQTLHDGPRPPGYEIMKKQGSIILGEHLATVSSSLSTLVVTVVECTVAGIGGDNSCGAIGTFYEGAMTATFTSDATDAAVQANIVAAGYGK